jgi:hypothetical protein
MSGTRQHGSQAAQFAVSTKIGESKPLKRAGFIEDWQRFEIRQSLDRIDLNSCLTQKSAVRRHGASGPAERFQSQIVR